MKKIDLTDLLMQLLQVSILKKKQKNGKSSNLLHSRAPKKNSLSVWILLVKTVILPKLREDSFLRLSPSLEIFGKKNKTVT